MAVSNNIETVSTVAVLSSRVAAAVQELVIAFRSRKIERATRAELMSLTDAELNDIGIARHQIRDLDLKSNA